MGTNYYARIIPKEKDIKELHELIDLNDFNKIREKTCELYESFRPYNMDDKPTGVIHLGKRSGGWKFLWNPNLYQIRNGHSEKVEIDQNSYSYHWIPEPDTPYYLYPLTKEGIKSFIDRDNIEIFDEYNEKQDKEEFFNEALSWGKEDLDSDSYHLKYPDEKVWNCKNEYTDFLESLGYKLSKNKSDFYSDGLRFSTSTDFC
jgi:hypothetical protein